LWFVEKHPEGRCSFVAPRGSGLEASTIGIYFNANQLIATAAKLITAGKGQATFAAVQNFDTLRVGAEIKRYKSLSGRVMILIVTSADQPGHLAKGHSQLHLRKFAVRSGSSDNLVVARRAAHGGAAVHICGTRRLRWLGIRCACCDGCDEDNDGYSPSKLGVHCGFPGIIVF
jgi:hypothetical protein